MDLKELIKTIPDSEVTEFIKELAKKAKTKPVYIRHIINEFKQPSPFLCRRLVAADKRLTLERLRKDIYGPIPGVGRIMLMAA